MGPVGPTGPTLEPRRSSSGPTGPTNLGRGTSTNQPPNRATCTRLAQPQRWQGMRAAATYNCVCDFRFQTPQPVLQSVTGRRRGCRGTRCCPGRTATPRDTHASPRHSAWAVTPIQPEQICTRVRKSEKGSRNIKNEKNAELQGGGSEVASIRMECCRPAWAGTSLQSIRKQQNPRTWIRCRRSEKQSLRFAPAITLRCVLTVML